MPSRHPVRPAKGSLPDDLLVQVVETFKALSDPTRAQLVYLLTGGEFSVNQLAEHVAVTPSAVSHHLAKLRAMRLVRTRRAGNQVFYSVDDVHVAALFREALSHLDHVRRNLPDHPIPDSLARLRPAAGAGHALFATSR
ncbi:MAG TPA: metalloregulator ArsR/SmtB family transcription factor [Caldilineaceae bacterium]|nr:metalloregulator ArsR/SmtB family transcription factor [Caldilineaceae bacterium]